MRAKPDGGLLQAKRSELARPSVWVFERILLHDAQPVRSDDQPDALLCRRPDLVGSASVLDPVAADDGPPLVPCREEFHQRGARRGTIVGLAGLDARLVGLLGSHARRAVDVVRVPKQAVPLDDGHRALQIRDAGRGDGVHHEGAHAMLEGPHGALDLALGLRRRRDAVRHGQGPAHAPVGRDDVHALVPEDREAVGVDDGRDAVHADRLPEHVHLDEDGVRLGQAQGQDLSRGIVLDGDQMLPLVLAAEEAHGRRIDLQKRPRPLHGPALDGTPRPGGLAQQRPFRAAMPHHGRAIHPAAGLALDAVRDDGVVDRLGSLAGGEDHETLGDGLRLLGPSARRVPSGSPEPEVGALPEPLRPQVVESGAAYAEAQTGLGRRQFPVVELGEDQRRHVRRKSCLELSFHGGGNDTAAPPARTSRPRPRAGFARRSAPPPSGTLTGPRAGTALGRRQPTAPSS